MKQPILMRRSTVLSLPPQLAFPVMGLFSSFFETNKNANFEKLFITFKGHNGRSLSVQFKFSHKTHRQHLKGGIEGEGGWQGLALFPCLFKINNVYLK